MTDYEINIAVAKKLGHEVIITEACGQGLSKHDYVTVRESGDNSYTLPDYCNSWADAGPIAEKHKISFSAYQIGAFMASDESGNIPVCDYNPTRAICKCFLAMGE